MVSRRSGTDRRAMTAASIVAGVVYGAITLLLRVEEAQRIERFVLRRVRARQAG